MRYIIGTNNKEDKPLNYKWNAINNNNNNNKSGK